MKSNSNGKLRLHKESIRILKDMTLDGINGGWELYPPQDASYNCTFGPCTAWGECTGKMCTGGPWCDGPHTLAICG